MLAQTWIQVKSFFTSDWQVLRMRYPENTHLSQRRPPLPWDRRIPKTLTLNRQMARRNGHSVEQRKNRQKRRPEADASARAQARKAGLATPDSSKDHLDSCLRSRSASRIHFLKPPQHCMQAPEFTPPGPRKVSERSRIPAPNLM
jgi:hypothetical protein